MLVPEGINIVLFEKCWIHGNDGFSGSSCDGGEYINRNKHFVVEGQEGGTRINHLF